MSSNALQLWFEDNPYLNIKIATISETVFNLRFWILENIRVHGNILEWQQKTLQVTKAMTLIKGEELLPVGVPVPEKKANLPPLPNLNTIVSHYLNVIIRPLHALDKESIAILELCMTWQTLKVKVDQISCPGVVEQRLARLSLDTSASLSSKKSKRLDFLLTYHTTIHSLLRRMDTLVRGLDSLVRNFSSHELSVVNDSYSKACIQKLLQDWRATQSLESASQNTYPTSEQVLAYMREQLRSVYSDPILIEGYLFHHYFNRGWKRLWVVLTRTSIYFAKADVNKLLLSKPKSLRDNILLLDFSDGSSVSLPGGTNSLNRNKKGKGSDTARMSCRFGIQINQQIFHFEAISKQDKETWIAAFEKIRVFSGFEVGGIHDNTLSLPQTTVLLEPSPMRSLSRRPSSKAANKLFPFCTDITLAHLIEVVENMDRFSISTGGKEASSSVEEEPSDIESLKSAPEPSDKQDTLPINMNPPPPQLGGESHSAPTLAAGRRKAWDAESSVLCGCPTHLDQVDVNQVLDIEPDDLFDFLYRDAQQYDKAHQELDKLTLVQHRTVVSPWNRVEGIPHMQVTLHVPVNNPLLRQKFAHVHCLMKHVRNEAGRCHVVELLSNSPKIPYGNSFTPVMRLCITREAGVGRSRLCISSGVIWHKSVLVKPMIQTATLAASGTIANQYLEIIMNHVKGEYQRLPEMPQIAPAFMSQQYAERKVSLNSLPMQELKSSIIRPMPSTTSTIVGWLPGWTGIQSMRIGLFIRLVLLLIWMAFCLEWAKIHVTKRYTNGHAPRLAAPLDPMVVLLRNATTPWQRDSARAFLDEHASNTPLYTCLEAQTSTRQVVDQVSTYLRHVEERCVWKVYLDWMQAKLFTADDSS